MQTECQKNMWHFISQFLKELCYSAPGVCQISYAPLTLYACENLQKCRKHKVSEVLFGLGELECQGTLLGDTGSRTYTMSIRAT
jgi:hypothetical protein